MRLFTILIFLMIGIVSANAYAPVDSTVKVDSSIIAKKKPAKVNVRKSLRKANKRNKGGNTYDASDMFVKVLDADSNNMKVAYKLGLNYYHERDYKRAERWFAKVFEKAPKDFPLSGYWLGLMMKMNGKYEEAKKQLTLFINTYRGDEAGKYKRWAKTDADGCDLAIEMKKHPLNIEVLHLDKNVNSPYSDISPLMWDDTTLLYGSLPIDTIVHFSKADTTKKEHYIHFYSATAVDTLGDYKNKTIFPQFNVQGLHSGNGTFSPDKKRFYYTECEQDKKNKIICSIYMSHYNNGVWAGDEKLPTEINIPGYTSTHPSIGKDAKGREVLFYTSDRPGGKGGMDIWFAVIKKDGSFTKPINAGKINTDRDEGTPFYDLNSDTLYFSSQGFPGMGGYDIFKVGGTLGKWNDPVNVGYPLNNQTDDMYYRRNDDHKTGFFVSNRPGIISIRSETCCDDIFAYFPPKPQFIFVRGYVIDKKTNEKIDGSAVDLATDNKVHLNSDTTRNGQMFFFPLEFNKDYRLDATHAGYLPGNATVSTQGLTKTDTLRQDIYLDKLEKNKAYRLRSVYYDWDKWFLRDEAKKTLDTLYDIMVANPLIIVELGSHTDSRATDYYNIVLSQHRAESCVEYLLSRGIPLERLRAKGYGETELLENCDGYKDCPKTAKGDCPCHQLNRRTEFKIVGELDAPLQYTDKRYEDVKGNEKALNPPDTQKQTKAKKNSRHHQQ